MSHYCTALLMLCLLCVSHISYARGTSYSEAYQSIPPHMYQQFEAINESIPSLFHVPSGGSLLPPEITRNSGLMPRFPTPAPTLNLPFVGNGGSSGGLQDYSNPSFLGIPTGGGGSLPSDSNITSPSLLGIPVPSAGNPGNLVPQGGDFMSNPEGIPDASFSLPPNPGMTQ